MNFRLPAFTVALSLLAGCTDTAVDPPATGGTGATGGGGSAGQAAGGAGAGGGAGTGAAGQGTGGMGAGGGAGQATGGMGGRMCVPIEAAGAPGAAGGPAPTPEMNTWANLVFVAKNT